MKIMSRVNKFTVNDFLLKKEQNNPITILTAYDYPSARILDQAGIDAILIGDSLGMVIQGKSNTIPVTIDEMIYHTQCVARGANHSLIIADMPFMSFSSPRTAAENAGLLIKKGGAQAVKLEGGTERVPDIKKILDMGIPVMGHIGLTPQYVNRLGGYRLQGTTAESAIKLIHDAQSLENAGIFAIVLEMVPKEVANEISKRLKIPTIGIGAGIGCDGQVLVLHDMLGMNENRPYKFVKQYIKLNSDIRLAVEEYISDIMEKKFPSDENSFFLSEENKISFFKLLENES